GQFVWVDALYGSGDGLKATTENDVPYFQQVSELVANGVSGFNGLPAFARVRQSKPHQRLTDVPAPLLVSAERWDVTTGVARANVGANYRQRGCGQFTTAPRDFLMQVDCKSPLFWAFAFRV